MAREGEDEGVIFFGEDKIRKGTDINKLCPI